MSIYGNLLSLGGGMKIKSIQSGSTTCSRSGTEYSTSINRVDLTKSIIFHNGHVYSTNAAYSQASYARLDTATSVTCRADNSGNDPEMKVYWTVVEFEDGISVQRGLVSEAASPVGAYYADVSITAVDLTKAAVVGAGWCPTGSWAATDCGMYLRSAFYLRVYANAAYYSGGARMYVPWQVVEFK